MTTRFEFPSDYTIYTLNVNFVISLRMNKGLTITIHDLYDIPHIFYKRIIHTNCLRTLTGYYNIYIYIYIISNNTKECIRDFSQALLFGTFK